MRLLSKPAIFVSLLMLAGCASVSFTPGQLTLPDELEGVQSSTIADVSVSVSILTDRQARQHFGVDLGNYGVQAIWIRIANRSPDHLWFIRNHLDRDVYSPDEVAVMAQSEVADDEFDSLQQLLRDESIRVSIPQNTLTQGFVFAPKHEGGRYIDVRLSGDAYEHDSTQADTARLRELRFGFAAPLPDGEFDHERLNPSNIYAKSEMRDLTLEELRQAIEQLPCCATEAGGESKADPINVVIIGRSTDVLTALSRSGWSFTHRISLRTVTRLIGSALQGEGYPVAPVSSIYMFGRKQDFAMQRARHSIAQRNHMRFWLAPFTYNGQQVWVGQISRDIGIKLTAKSPTLTTHIIDPQVDLAREYLLHSLLAEGFVKKFGFARGSMKASRTRPALNLTDDPYFSDGMRLVIMLSPDPSPLTAVHSLKWEQSSAPVAEGQSKEAMKYQQPIGADRYQVE